MIPKKIIESKKPKEDYYKNKKPAKIALERVAGLAICMD